MTKSPPIDNLAPLAKAGVPILHDCGSLDPWLNDQTRVVEKRYKELGGQITVIVREGEGHFPLAPKDPTVGRGFHPEPLAITRAATLNLRNKTYPDSRTPVVRRRTSPGGIRPPSCAFIEDNWNLGRIARSATKESERGCSAGVGALTNMPQAGLPSVSGGRISSPPR